MLNTVTYLCYLAGGLTQALLSIRNQTQHKFNLLFAFGVPAVLLHGYLLYSWIDLSAGQNLTELNLFSLATWVWAITILLISLKRSAFYLSVVIFPIASLSVYLASHFPTDHIIQTAALPKQFVHIILSVITFSILSLAGFQAVILALQEALLKKKSFAMVKTLPPVETMEKLLFQMIAVGAILLTIVLATSISFFHEILIQQFLQKTTLTLITWVVFTSLLIGRHYFGWRGRKAIYCTLGGAVILSLIYFGSLIIMEFIP